MLSSLVPSLSPPSALHLTRVLSYCSPIGQNSAMHPYVEYLVSTPKNCTCTYLAEHLEGVSHDVVNDFLRQKQFMPRAVWKLVKDRIKDSKDAFLIVDDSVHDKRYARFIELVRAQYSANE